MIIFADPKPQYCIKLHIPLFFTLAYKQVTKQEGIVGIEWQLLCWII